MSFASDTTDIIADSGSVTVFVYSRTTTFSAAAPTTPIQTTTIVETATCQSFPVNSTAARGSFVKLDKGEIAEETHRFYFPLTTTVSVGCHLKLSTDLTNYFEVLRIDQYEDHTRVMTRWVKGRQ